MEIVQNTVPFETNLENLNKTTQKKCESNIDSIGGINKRITLSSQRFKNGNETLSLNFSEIPNEISPVKTRKLKNPQNEPYDFSLYDYFMSNFLIIFKKTEQKRKIIKLKKAYKKLGLMKILTSLKELKTLKKILLYKDQVVIFNFINKQSIFIFREARV